MTKVSIVAPCYNESDSLTDLVKECVDAVDGLYEYEILLVDDGSTDDSRHTIENIAKLYDEVRGVFLSRNYGQSSALAAGINEATGEIICTIDADLQNDPADIPVLIGELQNGYDCVSGNRVDRNDPATKTIPSNIQTRLAKLTGPDINDFGCTLTVYRAEALDSIDLYGEGHRYIPAKLHDKGFKITELDVNHRERKHGSSHYGVGRLVRGFSDLLFHLIWNRYSTRPFQLFGGLGLGIFTTGFCIGVFLLFQKYLIGQALLLNLPQLLLSVGMVLFGLITIMFGVILQFLTRMYYRDEEPYRIDEVV